jgi:hypothetical protein
VAIASKTNSTSTTSSAVSASYVLGTQQKAQTDVFDVAIQGVQKNSSKDYAFAYDENDVMLIVDVAVTNRTTKVQNLVPSSQLYIRTEDGLYITMHPSMYVRNQLPFGQVASGETVLGQVSFAIPKTLTRPLLYIDLGWDNHVPVVYDILR